MNSTVVLIMLWSVVCLMILTIVAIWNLDRIIVYALQKMQIYMFPTAMEIANSFLKHGDSWKFDDYRASNPNLDFSIWIANGCQFVRVYTKYGDWSPNFIERRIIWNSISKHLAHNQAEKLKLVTQSLMKALDDPK